MVSDTNKTEIEEKITRLREKYLESLPEKVAVIETGWKELILPSSDQRHILKQLYQHTHNLTGSAGTFGAVKISNAAKQLEESLQKAIERANILSQDEYDLIEGHLTNLKNTIND